MIYFSADIETDGLVAGLHSMISLGCCAIDMDTGEIVGTWEGNILPLADLEPEPSTVEWWKRFPEAYERATRGARHASEVIPEFVQWVKSFGIETPVLAAWKPSFDVAFIVYYLWRFGGGNLFGRSGSGLDIKTLTAVALNQRYKDTKIGEVPAVYRERETHDHTALGDAIEQAHVMYHANKVLSVEGVGI